jgi:hypothetical protein
MRSSPELRPGDLVEINSDDSLVSYVVKISNYSGLNKPAESFYAPKGTIALWLGRELIDFSIDWVERDIIFYEGKRHIIINGDIKRVDVEEE